MILILYLACTGGKRVEESATTTGATVSDSTAPVCEDIQCSECPELQKAMCDECGTFWFCGGGMCGDPCSADTPCWQGSNSTTDVPCECILPDGSLDDSRTECWTEN